MGLAILGLALVFSGCASNRALVKLPYVMPATGVTAAQANDRPAAAIVNVVDQREDHAIDMFLEDRPADFVKKALAAELTAGSVFSTVTTTDPVSPQSYHIDVWLEDLSWAVPNHKRMVKTAFWTSFLTGGLGGLAYGSTSTPVFGHAKLTLKITEPGDNKVVLAKSYEGMYEEKIAKLKSDSLETRSRVMAEALKTALVNATHRIEALKLKSPSATQ